MEGTLHLSGNKWEVTYDGGTLPLWYGDYTSVLSEGKKIDFFVYTHQDPPHPNIPYLINEIISYASINSILD
jgi:hypothetical protein